MIRLNIPIGLRNQPIGHVDRPVGKKPHDQISVNEFVARVKSGDEFVMKSAKIAAKAEFLRIRDYFSTSVKSLCDYRDVLNEMVEFLCDPNFVKDCIEKYHRRLSRRPDDNGGYLVAYVCKAAAVGARKRLMARYAAKGGNRSFNRRIAIYVTPTQANHVAVSRVYRYYKELRLDLFRSDGQPYYRMKFDDDGRVIDVLSSNFAGLPESHYEIDNVNGQIVLSDVVALYPDWAVTSIDELADVIISDENRSEITASEIISDSAIDWIRDVVFDNLASDFGQIVKQAGFDVNVSKQFVELCRRYVDGSESHTEFVRKAKGMGLSRRICVSLRNLFAFALKEYAIETLKELGYNRFA